MPEFPSIPMRSNVSRSGQVIGKASGGASYVSLNFNLYWDAMTFDPNEPVDYKLGIFEVDSSLNAVRTILNLSYTDVDAAVAGAVISQSSLNLNEDNTTDYVVRLSFESDNAMVSIDYSSHTSGNGGMMSQAANLAAFGTSDVDVVTNEDVDLSSKTGYDSYTELAQAANNLKFRPGLTNPLWMWLSIS